MKQTGKAAEELPAAGPRGLRRWRNRVIAVPALLALFLFPAAPPLHALQAAVEYAATSGRSVVGGGSTGQRAHLGECPVDSRIADCVSRSYPKTLVAVMLTLFFLLFRLAYRGGRRTSY